MDERAQATVEYAGLALLLALVLAGAATAVRAPAGPAPRGDRAQLMLGARFAPTLLLERGPGAEPPVDFRRCRSASCAGPGARPVLFLHVVRRDGAVYLEYWEYEPDSRFARTGVAPLDGAHRDDWEGVVMNRLC